jgi:hypothetical protein
VPDGAHRPGGRDPRSGRPRRTATVRRLTLASLHLSGVVRTAITTPTRRCLWVRRSRSGPVADARRSHRSWPAPRPAVADGTAYLEGRIAALLPPPTESGWRCGGCAEALGCRRRSHKGPDGSEPFHVKRTPHGSLSEPEFVRGRLSRPRCIWTARADQDSRERPEHPRPVESAAGTPHWRPRLPVVLRPAGGARPVSRETRTLQASGAERNNECCREHVPHPASPGIREPPAPGPGDRYGQFAGLWRRTEGPPLTSPRRSGPIGDLLRDAAAEGVNNRDADVRRRTGMSDDRPNARPPWTGPRWQRGQAATGRTRRLHSGARTVALGPAVGWAPRA